MFLLLDMHRHVAATLPVLDRMMGGNPALAPLLGELRSLLALAAAAAGSLFGEYAESVARDNNKVLPLDGTVHPLTAQTLSYLRVRRIGRQQQSCSHHSRAWCHVKPHQADCILLGRLQ